MEEKITPIQLLDGILFWFAMDDNLWLPNSPTRANVTKRQISDDLIRHYPYFVNDTNKLFFFRYFNLALNKLVKDEYIDREIYKRPEGIPDIPLQPTRYSVNFDGKYFWQAKGGYAGELAQKNAESIRAAKLEKTQKDHQRWMTLLTFLIGLGTSVAAWYYGQQIWIFYHSCP